MPLSAVKSERVMTGGIIRPAMLIISDGIITDIVDPGEEVAMPVFDAGTDLVMPGVIDPHVHINEPGRSDWEGFDTATKAAAAGGVTTLVDMPLNSSPVTTSVDAFEQKLRAAERSAHVHCGFWGGIVPGNEDDIIPLAKRGVLGYKAFLAHSGIDEFPNVTEEDLRRAMPLIAGTGLPLLVHAELPGETIPGNKPLYRYRDYAATRPARWEEEAIALMIRLCREFRCRIHIVHLSAASAIDMLRRAKEEGLPVTVETAQHYLYFDADSIPDRSTIHKCAPPVRDKMNNRLLWEALVEGVIDFVATDHSPAPPAMKALDTADLTAAWGGIASIQFALPVLWTVARRNGATLQQTERWLCAKPAILAGLQERKGRIEKGFDADLVIWKPEEKFTVRKENILFRHPLSPYINEELYGVVSCTYLKGKPVFRDGAVVESKGDLIVHQPVIE